MKITFSSIHLSLPSVSPSIVIGHYDVTTLEPEDLLILPHHPTLLRAVPSRKAEHLAGRLAASKALQELGMAAQILAVGSHRQPLWPTGVIGSISHTRRLALAIVAKSSDSLCGLGIDVEAVLSPQQVEEVTGGVIIREESGLLTQGILRREEMLTLIFSAKESLFKTLFPRVGDYFDFSAAYMSAISVPTQRFTLTLVHDLSLEFRAGMTFSGQWCYLEGDILTLVSF